MRNRETFQPKSTRRSIIFDMDGTLINPLLGITNSYRHMCSSLGIPDLSEDEIRGLIGPSIQDALGSFFKFDQLTLERAIQLFRNHYSNQGILEYKKYPGIEELLTDLRQDGFTLHVATNKPVIFANQIVRSAGWEGLFSTVAGSPLDGSTKSKRDIIASVLQQLPADESVIAYIGDRPEDATGSRLNGLPFVGVSWGFSTEEKLLLAGAITVATSIQQLNMAIRDLQFS